MLAWDEGTLIVIIVICITAAAAAIRLLLIGTCYGIGYEKKSSDELEFDRHVQEKKRCNKEGKEGLFMHHKEGVVIL